jgi:hypothetical protein
MSLNQSINKIAPYVVTRSPGSSGETGALSFSPSFVQAKDQSYQHGEEDGASKNQQKEDKSAEPQEPSFPEMFKVVDSPDFSELFLLASGKNDSQLMLVIKKMRKQRGVTDLIPVSDVKKKQKTNQQERNIYMETRIISKGEQFTGEI